jgi:hypothetical protein
MCGETKCPQNNRRRTQACTNRLLEYFSRAGPFSMVTTNAHQFGQYRANKRAEKLNCPLNGVAKKLRSVYSVETAANGVTTDTQAVRNKYLGPKESEVLQMAARS